MSVQFHFGHRGAPPDPLRGLQIGHDAITDDIDDKDDRKDATSCAKGVRIGASPCRNDAEGRLMGRTQMRKRRHSDEC